MAKTIDDYKKDWAAANAAGDKAGMDAAHAAAEALRAQSGYSGGADGSQYIPLAATTGATTTTKAPAPTMPSGFQGSATGVGVNSNPQASIVQQMNQNSQKWWTATPEEREKLHAENESLAALLGGSVSYDSKSGTWSGAAGTAVDNIAPYSGSSTQIDGLLNAILNRQPFSYDYKTDPAYLAYEDKYKRLGDRAREDTLGDVAGLTGGLPSSWAVSAASQAQNDYNQQLSDVIPTLYDAAYNRYVTEDSMKRSDLGLVMDVDNVNYGRYRDTVGDAQWQTQFDYGVYRDSVGDAWNQKNFDYGVYRDNVGDAQWQKGYDLEKDSFDWGKSVDEWNMSTDEAKTKFNNLMTKWQVTGVADEEVAAGLGVPVGATTESYYFNKLNHELAVSKANSSGGGGDDSFERTNNLRLTTEEAKGKIKNTFNGTEYGAAAEHIINVGGKRGLDMEDYYSICKELGIPDSVADRVWTSNENEYLAAQENAANEPDFAYYWNIMGQQEDPEAWFEQNKYTIGDPEILEELRKALGLE